MAFAVKPFCAFNEASLLLVHALFQFLRSNPEGQVVYVHIIYFMLLNRQFPIMISEVSAFIKFELAARKHAGFDSADTGVYAGGQTVK
jgi:hypothetical protein